MAAMPMCTLKFYLYCKENKKGPNLGLEGEAKPQESQAVPLVGSAVAAGGPACALLLLPPSQIQVYPLEATLPPLLPLLHQAMVCPIPGPLLLCGPTV